jgi:hypothetical protein
MAEVFEANLAFCSLAMACLDLLPIEHISDP